MAGPLEPAWMRASCDEFDGPMRCPSPGRSLSPVVRTVMSDDPPFCGSVKVPVKTAPRASATVSPGCAFDSAACRSPPADTEIVAAVEIDAQRRIPAHTRRAVQIFFISILVDQIGGARAADAAL